MCLKKQNQENHRSARKRALTTIRTGSACGWVRRGVPGMVPWDYCIQSVVWLCEEGLGQEEATRGRGVSAVPRRVPVAQPRRARWGIVRVTLPCCPARDTGAGVPIRRRPSAPGCFWALSCLPRTATWPPAASGQSSTECGAGPVLVGAGEQVGVRARKEPGVWKWDSFPGGKGGARQRPLRSRLHAPSVPPPD